jgi:hypothetical protein
MRKQSDEQSRVIKPFLSTTIPPRASAHPGKNMKIRPHYPLPAYELADIDTVPPSASSDYDISSLDTVEQASYRRDATTSLRPDERVTPVPLAALPDVSRDNKHVSSDYRQYIAGAKKISKQPVTSPLNDYEYSRRSLRLNPLERVRWWLLYPGRIEFLLWTGGTLFLLFITVVLVLATMLSLHIFD